MILQSATEDSLSQVHEMLNEATNDNMESVIGRVVALCGQITEAYESSDVPSLHVGRLLQEARRKFFELECQLEKWKAEELIQSRQAVESYFFSADYEALIEQEWALVENYARSIGREAEGMRMAFIGSGAMPVSAMLLSNKIASPIVCVDADADANKIARAFVTAKGYEGKLDIYQAHAECFDYSEIDLVFMASLINPKPLVLDHIRRFDVAGIMARTVSDGYSMIYESMTERQVQNAGYRVVSATCRDEKCMHQSLLLSSAMA